MVYIMREWFIKSISKVVYAVDNRVQKGIGKLVYYARVSHRKDISRQSFTDLVYKRMLMD